MNRRFSNILIYIIVVVFPAVIGTIYYLYDAMNRDDLKRHDHAKWIASIHISSLDQFISETVTSLNILAITAETEVKSPEKLNYLMQKLHNEDPRYGGIYLLDPNGKVIIGSTSYLKNADLSKTHYIKEILRTKDIIISNHQETLLNEQKVIGIGEPVLDGNGKLLFIIIAHLRSDYIQNIMRLLTPDTRLSVLNSNQAPIIDINTNRLNELKKDDSVVLPSNRLPWSIMVEIPKRNTNEIIKQAIPFIIRFIFICHIVFLFIKYLLLKRQAVNSKKENEIQKLELVGSLAASTAHEIRNPLTGIKGLVQLLSEKHRNSDDQYYFSVINDEINRINEIVSEFLILGKPTAQKTDIIDMRTIITELDPLILSEAALNKVNYESFIPEKPIFVDCIKDQMKQVLLNLTKNSFEAMAEGDHLSITLDHSQSQCHIKISDTGSGIPEEELDKIFQPFYTSKDTGTGLGLVICKRIIESFDGEISVSSSERKGTVVNIFLPAQISKKM